MSGNYGGNGYAWGGGTNGPHISRYYSARGWIMPGETVIDAACATGYGSYLLAQNAKKVIGLEVDASCVDEANLRWPADNIEYRVLDLGKDELPDADVLISIETGEHVNGLDHFLDQMWKHISRCVVFCVPIGGSSWDYTPEQLLTPAGENNDFMNDQEVIAMFMDRGWNLQWHNSIGYSSIFIFYKKPPKMPKGYDENGFPEGHRDHILALEALKNE